MRLVLKAIKEKSVVKCNEPFLNYLKQFGYCVVRLPKADVRPLQIYSKKGNTLDRLGHLTTLFQTGNNIPLPQVIENTLAADISGRRTSDLNIGLGISILEGVLSSMGGQSFDLQMRYKRAETLTFLFHDVLEDKIELAELDQYLVDADINPFSNYVAQLLDADDVYVTTDIIKSQKFTVEAKRSDGTSLDLSIPEIQDIVGGKVQVSGKVGETSKLTFEGNIPLVFGFKAVQLFYDQGEYTTLEPAESGVSMRRGEASVKSLKAEGAFLRLSDG
jgi:hypothetical protein